MNKFFDRLENAYETLLNEVGFLGNIERAARENKNNHDLQAIFMVTKDCIKDLATLRSNHELASLANAILYKYINPILDAEALIEVLKDYPQSYVCQQACENLEYSLIKFSEYLAAKNIFRDQAVNDTIITCMKTEHADVVNKLANAYAVRVA